MIISKPKSSALISLGIFIILCFALGGYALRAILNEAGVWYHYLISSLALSVAFILLLRQVLSYKIIKIGEMVKVSYPFRWKVMEFKLKDIIQWKQIVIKTKNAPFKQLELKFNGYLLKLSVQENTNYESINKYLKKRAGKKEIS